MCAINTKEVTGALYASSGQPDFMMRHHTGVH